jgi:hypothetical protein
LLTLQHLPSPLDFTFLCIYLSLPIPRLSFLSLLQLLPLPRIEDRGWRGRNKLLSVLTWDIREGVDEVNVAGGIHVPVLLSVSVGSAQEEHRGNEEIEGGKTFHSKYSTYSLAAGHYEKTSEGLQGLTPSNHSSDFRL